MSSAKPGLKPVEKTVITKERVVGPPDRFIAVTDGELLSYFKSSFSETDKASLSQFHEMMEGMCVNSFSRLRQSLEEDFAYFSNSAAGVPGTDPRELDPSAYVSDLDKQEERFLLNFLQLLEAGHYKYLNSSEWDAAQAEEFLLTLPVTVNWNVMDNAILPRALWSHRPEERAAAPAELADRMLIFHRGVDVAHIQGTYILRKIDLLLTFLILQPLFKIFAPIMRLFGVKKFVPEAPAYMAPVEEAEAAINNAAAAAAAKVTAAAIRSGTLHEASINIERRTFARTFPTAKSVFNQLFKRVDLREACFKDVIVLYRKAVPEKGGPPPGEFDIIREADPAFLQRNFMLKRFRSIPIADLELVFPEKNIYMPPQVMLQMIITAVTLLLAVVTFFRGGVSTKALWPLFTMLGSRLGQLYSTSRVQKTTIERAMQNLLYDRTVASQEAVVASLTDEMARQRCRELLIAYLILVLEGKSITPDELDSKCESFLSSQFGLTVDFTTEDALSPLLEWGLVIPENPTVVNGPIKALPLTQGMAKLDSAWDNLFSFTASGVGNTTLNALGGTGEVETLKSQPSSLLGKVLSTAVDTAAATAVAASPSPSATSSGVTAQGKKKSFFSRLTKS